MVRSRLHLAVDHSVDVDVLRGVDVDVYIMLVQVWLMLAEGRAGRIASPVFDDGRIIGSGVRTVFFCLRDGLRLDIRKVDGIAVQTSNLIRVEVRVLAVVRRTVEIHFRNNGVLLAGVLHQNVRPAVDGIRIAELPLGRIVLIPLIMRMADLIQLDVLCCEVVQQVAASASHAGEKLRLGGLVIVGDRFDDDLLIVIDHADDIRPAVDRDRIKTCGRGFGVRLVLVPLVVVVPAVEVVFAGAVCSVVVGNVERSQINDCTLRLLFERNCLEFLGRVAVAVDHNVDGLQVELPLRRQRHGLGDRGGEIERFCCVLFEPAEELVAFLGGCSRLVRGCIALDRLCVDRRHAFHVDVERYVVVGVNVSPCIGDNPLFGRVVFRPLHIAPVVAFLTIGCRVKRLAALVVQADVDVGHVRIRLVGRVSRKCRFLQLLFQLRVVDQIAIQTLDASGNNHASGILGGLLAAIQEKRCGNGVLFTCQLADQFILLGHIELGDALVRVAKVLCGLIPAVEVVAGLFAAFEVIGRKIVLVVPVGDGEIVDLLAVLVIDRVPHGELIVRVQLHVAGLGDLRDNIAFRIAPVEELLRPFVVLEIRSLEGDRKLIRSKGLGVIDVFNVRGLDHTAPVVGDGVFYRLPDGGEGNVADDSPLMVCRIQRLAVGLGVRGDDRRILRSAPAEEGVALAGRRAQRNAIIYQIVTVGGHVLDFVVRPGIKRDALERHGAVEMVSVDLAVGFVALVCGIGHELQRVLAVPANAVQHALVELFGIDLAVERELAIVNLVCHACNVGLRGHQLAKGDELAACVEAFREAKTRKRRNGLRIALGKSNALVGRLHVDIDGLFHILQLAIELPILGIIECLGALVGVAEVLRILIPSVKLVAVLFNTLGLVGLAEVVFRNVDRFAVRFDLVAVLVIDRVADGVVPVGIDGQVAGRASRDLGDLLSNAVLVQIAAPLQEGLAKHAVLRNGVQNDSIFNRVRLSVFGIKLLLLNVLVAVVVRDRVLDGCEVAVENPRLVKELCDFALLADVFGLLVPAGELVAGLFGRRPERVILAASNRNVFLVCVHPFAVFVLQPVRDMEGVLLPDSVEDIVRLARGAHPAICSQVFHGEGCDSGAGVGRPAEELVALADGNSPTELERHNTRTRRKGLRLRLGQVRHRLARGRICVVGQRQVGRLARDVDLRDRCAETPRVICIG